MYYRNSISDILIIYLDNNFRSTDIDDNINDLNNYDHILLIIHMNLSLEYKKKRLNSHEVKTTKRYIDDLKKAEENQQNPKHITGLFSLVCPGTRDWRKKGETDDEYYTEQYNYYFANND